jgi:hypothetical protein
MGLAAAMESGSWLQHVGVNPGIRQKLWLGHVSINPQDPARTPSGSEHTGRCAPSLWSGGATGSAACAILLLIRGCTIR